MKQRRPLSLFTCCHIDLTSRSRVSPPAQHSAGSCTAPRRTQRPRLPPSTGCPGDLPGQGDERTRMSVFSWLFLLCRCFEIHNIAENITGKIVKVRRKGNIKDTWHFSILWKIPAWTEGRLWMALTPVPCDCFIADEGKL